jgi:methylated-DNA-[protein]-cysteine S-methyltransferase
MKHKALSEYIDSNTIAALTPFQMKVYQELINIPAGQVISYQSLAKNAGSPKAARAVGHAMAINPCVPIIPCHRVVSACGKIGHYSAGGPTIKKDLLLKEGVKIEGDQIIQNIL